MPKLRRETFLASIDDIWGLARNNFARDRVLHNTLVAVNGMSRQKYFMQAEADNQDALRRGFVPVPGPWVDHQPLIDAEFQEHGTVAAIMIGEAWIVRNDVAVETIRMNIAPHEHPMKEEIVFVIGFWPREFVNNGYLAMIERDERAENPKLVQSSPLGSNRADFLGSWLQDLLPGPR